MTQSFSFADFGGYLPGAPGLIATGSTQADALPILRRINLFATVAAGTGCMLPQATSSRTLQLTIINRGANALLVYPPPGGKIEGGSTNAPVSIVAGGAAQFVTFDSPLSPGINWFTH
jgi:hypothetical protein